MSKFRISDIEVLPRHMNDNAGAALIEEETHAETLSNPIAC